MPSLNYRNFDATEVLPPTDRNGRLVLRQSGRDLLSIGAVCVVCILLSAASGAIICNIDYGIVPRDGQIMDITWFIFAFSTLGTTILGVALFLPVRLAMDDMGITLRKFGLSRTLIWNDVRDVKLLDLSANTNYSTVASESFTVVKGRIFDLSWGSEFRVNPRILVTYIKTRIRENPDKTQSYVDNFSKQLLGFANSNLKARRAFAKRSLIALSVSFVLFSSVILIIKLFDPGLVR